MSDDGKLQRGLWIVPPALKLVFKYIVCLPVLRILAIYIFS
jgi:hypothetical protein